MSAPPPDLAPLQARLGHTFADPALLVCALTHPSYTSEHPDSPPNNQRLELLGDAVLQLIITDALFAAYPAEREGALSKSRSTLTRGGFFARLARELDLGAALLVGNSEEQTGGRDRDSNLEDAFEALAGALYLDAGLEPARRVILALYGPIADRLQTSLPADNPKGRLQELVQPLHGNTALRYVTAHVSGEDHQREYESTVHLLDNPLGTGRGPSKKAAEEAAARTALAAWPA
ncbi:MAG: ribonuclease III [Verrucomicrobiota bacterium]